MEDEEPQMIVDIQKLSESLSEATNGGNNDCEGWRSLV